MTRHGKFLLVACLLLTAVLAAGADEVADFRCPLVRDGWSLVRSHWQSRTLATLPDAAARETSLAALADERGKLIAGLTEKLRRAVRDADTGSLDAFARFLHSRPQAEREALAPLLDELRDRTTAGRPTVYLPDGLYIPGYGMPDPDYMYARTDTVESRVVGHYWQERFHHMVVNELWQGTVAVSVIPALQEKVHDYEETGPTMTVQYTDNALTVREVRFRMNSYWRFRVLRQFGIVRTDFELWRARRDAWYLEWERCGNCYELGEAVQEPRVIIGLQ